MVSVPSPAQVEVIQSSAEDAFAVLLNEPDRFPRPFRWHDDANRREVLDLLDSIDVASRHDTHLYGQQQLAVNKGRAILARDVAQAAHAAQRTRQPSAPMLQQVVGRYDQRFEVERGITFVGQEQRRLVWEVERLEHHQQLLPAQAMRVLGRVLDAGIAPEAMWVATIYELQPAQRLHRDPILYLQFGCWFVAIAQWD